MELPADAIQTILDAWPVARLTTLDPDGAPRSVPIVFARVGEALWSPIDGKPKRSNELARVRDVRRDPRVTLLLDHYGEDWRELWWLRVAARAEVLVAGGEGGCAPDEVAAVGARLRRKYPQYGETPLFEGAPTLIRFSPEHTTSWMASEAALGRLPQGDDDD